jgi:hypothetical protein
VIDFESQQRFLFGTLNMAMSYKSQGGVVRNTFNPQTGEPYINQRYHVAMFFIGIQFRGGKSLGGQHGHSAILYECRFDACSS